MRRQTNLLNKSITTTSSLFFFLKLNELKFSEGLKYILKIAFSNTEMDVANIQPMEWNGVMVAACSTFRIAGLAILFSLGQLSNDRNS